MLIDYPYEWEKYMIDGKIRTFRADLSLIHISEPTRH